MIFIIRLKEPHQRKGLSPYLVWKATGVSLNTVRAYTDEPEIHVKSLREPFFILCRFYGVDWRDPAVLDVVDDEESESDRLEAEVA